MIYIRFYLSWTTWKPYVANKSFGFFESGFKNGGTHILTANNRSRIVVAKLYPIIVVLFWSRRFEVVATIIRPKSNATPKCESRTFFKANMCVFVQVNISLCVCVSASPDIYQEYRTTRPSVLFGGL